MHWVGLGSERRRRLGVLVGGVGVVLMLAGFALSPATVASAMPRGNSNNGDVKIQDAGDSDFPPENDPHVDCPFDLVFYNFDANQQVTVTLDGQQPSGNNEPLVWGPTVVVADANGFARIHILAGDLNLAGLTAHPEGGANDLDDKGTGQRDRGEPTFHLKLDVQTFAGQHLFKHKVFWVGECTSRATAVSSSTIMPPTSTSPTTSTTQRSTVSTSSTTSTTVKVSPESVSATSTSMSVATLGSTSPPTSTTARSGRTTSESPTGNQSLPFTGTPATVLGCFGIALTLGGLTLSGAAARRRSGKGS